MRFEIVVAPAPSEPPPEPSPSATLHLVRRAPRRHMHELLDVFVDGANVTARIRERHGAFVLRDLALALVDLSMRDRGKASVRFYDEPWEMCVERFGAAACLSVYRSGPDPLVAVYDRAVPFADIVVATRDALDRVLGDADAKTHAPAARLELVSAAAQLRNLAPAAEALQQERTPVPVPAPVVVELDRDVPLSFGAEFAMRPGPEATLGAETTERADLHALLFRGRVRADIRGRAIDLGECHPFLVAERLVELARRAFDSWERGLPLHARGESAGVLVGVRVDGRGQVALTLGAATHGGSAPAARRAIYTFPALGVADMLEAALSFGRSLVRAILRRDRTQSANLRLSAFRRALREGTEALREASQTDSKVNPTPEPYRAFAAALHEAVEARSRESSTLPAARLRYATRWRAIVPGIDLRATYLCGDRMIVGAASEMWALDRASGRVLWRVDVARGTSVVTPGGIARLASDGTLAVHDFGNGEITLRARIAPRVGGPVSGAVVHLPGLPKLVIVTEGEHHLVAIDLTSGEPRWRWSWSATSTKAGRSPSRTPRAPRLKRAGRLLYVTCGDGALTALDVMSGAVVWRVRDRLRFRTPPTVAHDALYVVAGGAHGVARLYCIDAFSGRVRWATDVTDPSSPCTVEGAPMVLTGQTGGVAVAVRNKRTGGGLSLVAFRPEDGSPIAPKTRVVAPSGTSWLAVDDAFIGNAPSGELVAIAADGELLWRNVLGPRPLEADVPRRLEPVLRSGALFVPQTDVVVVRPRDGAVLGTIAPTEAIPDLLRVDERADVYVAEESGHLVCFGALPRLSLV
ncbi:MAG TPA: PQQ-binding-like beta-propeller repeat protein [Polyangiaceae bacterium]